MRVFVTTDTHGCRDRLEQVLKDASFDYEKDQLIHLGDCVDRGPDSKGVVDLLLKVKNLIAIKGNHDDWWLEFIEKGQHPSGGAHGVGATIRSYMIDKGFDEEDLKEMDHDKRKDMMTISIPQTHKEFFRNQKLYHIDDDGRFFCHAGFNRHYTILEQPAYLLYWDRDLFLQALSTSQMQSHPGLGEYNVSNVKPKLKMKDNFKRIFIGHTPTLHWKQNSKSITTPIYAAQVVNLDTGGVFDGKISLLDITDDDNHILYQA